ncbi:MAG: hypothetical protein SFY80_13755 [Verrucomicrobiota bacterium]|nr:hypothetical protein [Verrucomicrobiota bacterium]
MTQTSAFTNASEPVAFSHARPVWVRGLHERMNTTVGFHTTIHSEGAPTLLRLVAANTYRIWINGAFFAYGPARAGHGYLRMDEWDLSPVLQPGVNHIAIEVVAYRVNSFAVLNAPGCLQAEIISGSAGSSTAIAWTCARTGHFSPGVIVGRIRRMKRYSYQRPISEAYRLSPASDAWRTEGWGQREYPPFLDNIDQPGLLPRRMPYPEFPLRPLSQVNTGEITPAPEPVTPYTNRFTQDIGLNLLGFTNDEIEIDPALDWNRCRFGVSAPIAGPSSKGPLQLASNRYADYDLGANRTGFLRVTVTCTKPCHFLAGWAEVRTPEVIDVYQQETINLVSWELSPGAYTLETFEAYTFRHLRLAVLTGDLEITSVEQRGYESPARLEAFSSDPALASIQRAALSTFRQNTVDIFMDCPSRERAGWLGDSFFIGRAAARLGHPLAAETAFLENYLLAANPFFGLPPGMFPMCYPSDHYQPVFIPQWTLWLVLQLGEYQQRGGESWLIKAFEPRIRDLFAWFESYRNEVGLLEKLPGWNFVEWSMANNLTHDVNFPTQFLYAAALRTAGKLYGDETLNSRAREVTSTALALSRPTGQPYFRDRALRQGSALEVAADCTEICQYSPFFFNAISRQQEPELWEKLVRDFGPGKKVDGVHPANLLFGWVMRFDLLKRAGLHDQLQREVKSIFGPMAASTGTLWEHDHAVASLCHGFGSYSLCLID